MIAFLLLGSLLVGFGRLAVPGHDLSWAGSYEALAHVWVGVLLTLGVIGPRRRCAWGLLTVLTVFETLMFLRR